MTGKTGVKGDLCGGISYIYLFQALACKASRAKAKAYRCAATLGEGCAVNRPKRDVDWPHQRYRMHRHIALARLIDKLH